MPEDAATIDLTWTQLPVAIDVDLTNGSSELTADVVLVYCRDDAESLCLIEQLRFRLAVTVDAAHQLRLDHELGTIQAGKLADLVALSEDPHDVDPMTIKDIDVRGTVVGGEIHR